MLNRQVLHAPEAISLFLNVFFGGGSLPQLQKVQTFLQINFAFMRKPSIFVPMKDLKIFAFTIL
jgi:hypothetical protein